MPRVTTLPAFMPEMPALPGALPASGAVPQTSALPGVALDFAGLLDAATPATMPAPLPPTPATMWAEPAAEIAAPALAVPTGKALPEPGVQLPLAVPPLVSTPERAALPSGDDAMPAAPAPADGDEGATPVPLPPSEPAPDSARPALAAEPDDHDAPAPVPALENSDPAQIAALIPAPLAPSAAPMPPAPIVVTAKSDPPAVARVLRAAQSPVMLAENVPLPARVAMPVAATEDTSDDGAPPSSAQPSSAQPSPAQPSPAMPSAPLAALSGPEAPAPTPPPVLANLAPAPQQPAAAPASPAPEQRPASAQIESTIAQVGDIREALRSARPEMTLRHAEFGMVSLRVEQAAPDNWRAVLASRDPGFVPAIHAALADRSVAAASDSAASFFGQSGTGQNGTADQRYGASPNSGQGGSQPYLGHSGSRDGEAAPDHRRPSTAAALAARGEEREEGSGSRATTPGGMFA